VGGAGGFSPGTLRKEYQMTLKQVELTLYKSIDYSVAFVRVADTYPQIECYSARANEVAFLLRQLGFIDDKELERLYNEIEYERVEALLRVRDSFDVSPPPYD
jgi:hypothetical protein